MLTSEIEEMIRESEELDMDLIRENQAPSFSEYVVSLLVEKNIRRSQLISDINLDRNYGYQILNGTRMPTRNQIVHIGLALGVNVAEMQKMLTLGRREILYVRRPEDAKVVHCLEHNTPYNKACDFIWKTN